MFVETLRVNRSRTIFVYVRNKLKFMECKMSIHGVQSVMEYSLTRT